MSITLRDYHREMIIESLQLVCDYKVRALKKRSWQTFETEYLPSIIEQIQNNEFKLNDPKSNTFIWLIDQVCWSRYIIEGCHYNEGLPIIDSELGQQVAELCRVASRGQRYYDLYYRGGRFNDLFEYA